MDPFLDVLAVQFHQMPFLFEPLVRLVLHVRLELPLDLLARAFRVRVAHLPGDEIARGIVARRHGAEPAPPLRRRPRTVLLRPCGYDDALTESIIDDMHGRFGNARFAPKPFRTF